MVKQVVDNNKIVLFVTKKVYMQEYFGKKNFLQFTEFFFFGVQYNITTNVFVYSFLRNLYGIGLLHRFRILGLLKMGMSLMLANCVNFIRMNLEKFLRSLIIGHDKRIIFNNFLYEKYNGVNSYHSIRSRMGLPIRGQRTHSNSGSFKKLRRLGGGRRRLRKDRRAIKNKLNSGSGKRIRWAVYRGKKIKYKRKK
jgi:ribosomal protein S13